MIKNIVLSVAVTKFNVTGSVRYLGPYQGESVEEVTEAFKKHVEDCQSRLAFTQFRYALVSTDIASKLLTHFEWPLAEGSVDQMYKERQNVHVCKFSINANPHGLDNKLKLGITGIDYSHYL